MRCASLLLQLTRHFIQTSLATLCLLIFTGTAWSAYSAEEITVEIKDTELFLLRFNAEGEHLIIWISPGFGDLQRSYDVAEAISRRGIEVWHIDLAESLFLTQSTNTLRALDGSYVAGLFLKHTSQQENPSP
jgi:hypothetical protein